MNDVVSVVGIEHTGIAISDPAALAQWYRETLGAVEISRSSDDPPIIFLSFRGGSLLELIPENPNASVSETASLERIGRDHVHLCFSVDNLEVAVEHLRRRGTPLERPVFVAYEGSSVAFFRDPAGNLLQLVQRVADSGIHSEAYGD